MRGWGALLGLAGTGLAACSAAPAGTALPKGDPIACALQGAQTFAKDCAVERKREGDALVLTVHHPDGGFRRFEVLQNGKGLAPADGALPVQVSFADGVLSASIDADRYQFPATAMAHADAP